MSRTQCSIHACPKNTLVLVRGAMAPQLKTGQGQVALVQERPLEKLLPEIARMALPSGVEQSLYRRTYEETMLLSPSFTLRGGTREILRGVIARGLGLR